MSEQNDKLDELMRFLTSFRGSVEEKITRTNEKLDGKLEVLNVEMSNMNVRLTNVETDGEEARKRMDERLRRLENAMKKSIEIRNKSSELRTLETSLRREKQQEVTDQPAGIITAFQGIIDKEVVEKEKEVELKGTYRSNWARRMENELAEAAARQDDQDVMRLRRIERDKEERKRSQAQKEKEEEYQTEQPARTEPENIGWEILEPARRKVKVRKPPKITCWFGDEEISCSSSDENTEEWTEIEKRKKSKEKKRKQYEKRKTKQHETAMKASAMIGLGPIDEKILKQYENEKNDVEYARRKVVREFLSYHLAFNEEDLNLMDIRETKSSKDTIYVALGNSDMIREIYLRKAESKNDDFFLRNYVPPGFYDRYMAISEVCNKRRADNSNLKTQMKFGTKDVEVFTKLKNGNEGYRKVDLREIMGDTELPAFQHNIQWKKFADRPARRKIDYTSRRQRPACVPTTSEYNRPVDTTALDPARRNKVGLHPSITRQHSEGATEKTKKMRTEEQDQDMSSGQGSSDDDTASASGDDNLSVAQDPLASDLQESECL